jgi:hypothetical protein
MGAVLILRQTAIGLTEIDLFAARPPAHVWIEEHRAGGFLGTGVDARSRATEGQQGTYHRRPRQLKTGCAFISWSSLRKNATAGSRGVSAGPPARGSRPPVPPAGEDGHTPRPSARSRSHRRVECRGCRLGSLGAGTLCFAPRRTLPQPWEQAFDQGASGALDSSNTSCAERKHPTRWSLTIPTDCIKA